MTGGKGPSDSAREAGLGMIEHRQASPVAIYDRSKSLVRSLSKNRLASQERRPTRPSRKNNRPVYRNRDEPHSMPSWRANVRQAGDEENKAAKDESYPGGSGDGGGINSSTQEGPLCTIQKGEGVVTIEMVLTKCGRSLVEPSAVSSPMDFLTSEAEHRRVWQVHVSGNLNLAPALCKYISTAGVC